MKPRIRKEPDSGIWHIVDGRLMVPAANWGEAIHFVHDMGQHRTKNQKPVKRVRRKPSKPQIIAEEYPHFEMLLGPKLARQRLATVYNVIPKTIEKYLTTWNSPRHDSTTAVGG
mgnify:CR=1 FL=1